MSELICRRCGGLLELTEGETICTCLYCGVKQTLPKFTEEQKTNLFGRAERYLSASDFDSAALIYERMLTEDFDDAELHWSLFLCRLGVSYVEDLGSGRRIPTINRVQSREVKESSDLCNALKYADERQAELYREQAEELEEIRCRILALSAVEKPYDIFISCKQDDGSGNRTPDSVMAQNIYSRLTAEHYRVFFSRVTLEDKAGTAFEPYIYAALNSAKVMMVVGTSRQYFNAPWVKNEWSRYLALINSGGKKSVIPLYKDISPIDIPAELSGFQAIDMSRVGFMEDLLVAVKRLASPEGSSVVRVFGENISGTIDTARQLLQRGDYAAAARLAEQALNLDPENGGVYLIKLLIEYQASDIEELSGAAVDFSQSPNYRMTMRYSDDGTRERLREVNLRWLYNYAVAQRAKAEDEASWRKAAEGFFALGDYQDSPQQYDECIANAERIKQEEAERKMEREYSLAKDIADDVNAVLEELKTACEILKTLGEYKNSPIMLAALTLRINNIILENQRREQERQQQAAARQEYLNRRKLIIGITAGVSAVLLLVAVVCAVSIPDALKNNELASRYTAAEQLRSSGDYTAAIEGFRALGDYKDSTEQIQVTQYQQAEAAAKSGDYKAAADLFKRLGYYRNSADRYKGALNSLAEKYISDGDWYEAAEIYGELGDSGMVYSIKMQQVDIYAGSDSFDDALALLRSLEQTHEVREKTELIKRSRAEYLIANGRQKDGIEALYEMEYREDAKKAAYRWAEDCLAAKDFERAIEIFGDLRMYSDSSDRAEESEYLYAVHCQDTEDYEKAAELFGKLEDYKDSAAKYTECRYLYAGVCFDSGSYAEAAEIYEELGGYADSIQKLSETQRQKFMNCGVGDEIQFGSYIQERSGSAMQPLEWIVLSRSGNNVLIISRDIIGMDVYSSATNQRLSWKDSHLRSSLNSSFITTAFSADERSSIMYTEISDGGNVTGDRVFVLSKSEAMSLFGKSSERRAELTGYAGKQYVDLFGSLPNVTSWWLRDSTDIGNAKIVGDNGKVSDYGSSYHDYHGVRPAMWITLK